MKLKHFLPLGLGMAALLVSCSESPMKKALREDVEKSAKEFDIKYKLTACNVVDTVDVGRRLGEIIEIGSSLELLGDKITKEEFEAKRNQEFKELRSDTSYEAEVMNGELRDASAWCTEIRERTEYADSVLANWDGVNKHDWKFISAIAWYNFRSAQFYGNESSYWLESRMSDLETVRPAYEEYISLSEAPIDSILYLAVEHEYSIFNPLMGKRTELKDSVVMTPDNKIISRHSKTDFAKLLMEMSK